MKKSVRLTAFTLIILINGILLFFILLFILEFSGFSHKITKKLYPEYYEKLPLHKTDYYGKVLQKDPYSKFYKKYLHPYFLFSLPFKEEQIKKVNNFVVSLDKKGFRENPYYDNQATFKAIFLGGSTAFSQYSSSNKSSIAALLSKEKYKFYNLNAPSWNSHQELVALLKSDIDYKLSISLSLANDIVLGEMNCRTKLQLDAPESFNELNESFEYIGKIKQQKISRKIKSFLADYFLDTSILFTQIKKSFIQKNDKVINKKGTKLFNIGCSDEIYKAILKNQKQMKLISDYRNAKHIFVIQPFYSIHKRVPSFSKILMGEEFVNNVKYIIKKLKNSNFCKDNCLDLSSIFDNTEKGPSAIFENKNSVNYIPKYFVDEVHLTDDGNMIVAEKINEKILSF